MESKFSGILDAAKGREAETVEKEKTPPHGRKTARRRRASTSEAAAKTAKPGRATKAPRSRNPAYVNAGAYIPRELHKEVRSRLILQGKEYSELVEELLADWLAKSSKG